MRTVVHKGGMKTAYVCQTEVFQIRGAQAEGCVLIEAMIMRSGLMRYLVLPILIVRDVLDRWIILCSTHANLTLLH